MRLPQAYDVNSCYAIMRETAICTDHLGSLSPATNSSGAVVSRQNSGPWGMARGQHTTKH
jgi:hypothetical protein